MVALAATPRMGMVVVTQCTTVDDFVAEFQHLCTETTCFIPTGDRRPVGVETGFSIRLADGTPVLSGLGVVLAGDHEQPGILLELRALTASTRPMFEQISHSTDAIPVIIYEQESGKIAASRSELADMVRPTIQMPPLFADEPTARPPMSTTLGVAPLAPATVSRAPFVIDTPVTITVTREAVVSGTIFTGPLAPHNRRWSAIKRWLRAMQALARGRASTRADRQR